MKEATIKKKKLPQSRADKIINVVIYGIIILVLVAILYPLWLVVIASVSSSSAVMRGEVWIVPKEFSLTGYERIFSYTRLWNGYLNTIIYTVVGTVISLICTLPAAYALSKKEFYGRKLFTGMFLFAMFFNGGMIPTYLTMQNYGLLDTMWAVILPGAVATYNLILCRSFFVGNIPSDLWESAQLDGCSHAYFFMKIVLPISKAIISVMVLYYAVTYWNSYFNALMYLTSQEKYPLQIILRDILLVNSVDSATMTDSNAVDEMFEIMLTMKYGVIIVSSLPIIGLYLLVQKHFEKGVLLGSVKG
ncbi:MAG: carbohydrate ABC transporter permease [Hydrogeniiclostridium sp.]